MARSTTAFLGNIGRRHIHGDSLERKFELVFRSAPLTDPCFYRSFRETDDG